MHYLNSKELSETQNIFHVRKHRLRIDFYRWEDEDKCINP